MLVAWCHSGWLRFEKASQQCLDLTNVLWPEWVVVQTGNGFVALLLREAALFAPALQQRSLELCCEFRVPLHSAWHDFVVRCPGSQ